MLGKAWAGKGKQPHGERRGGEPANTHRDQMRTIWHLWHPAVAPCLALFKSLGLDSLLIFWYWQRFRVLGFRASSGARSLSHAWTAPPTHLKGVRAAASRSCR